MHNILTAAGLSFHNLHIQDNTVFRSLHRTTASSKQMIFFLRQTTLMFSQLYQRTLSRRCVRLKLRHPFRMARGLILRILRSAEVCIYHVYHSCYVNKICTRQRLASMIFSPVSVKLSRRSKRPPRHTRTFSYGLKRKTNLEYAYTVEKCLLFITIFLEN